MKKRIQKLTPAVLKRIIAEEKNKLRKKGLLKESTPKRRRKAKKLSLGNQVELLKVLREARKRKSGQLKRINRLSKKIKSKIMREL